MGSLVFKYVCVSNAKVDLNSNDVVLSLIPNMRIDSKIVNNFISKVKPITDVKLSTCTLTPEMHAIISNRNL